MGEVAKDSLPELRKLSEDQTVDRQLTRFSLLEAKALHKCLEINASLG